jgi:cytochrome b subunit of formate dehydrogenase
MKKVNTGSLNFADRLFHYRILIAFVMVLLSALVFAGFIYLNRKCYSGLNDFADCFHYSICLFSCTGNNIVKPINKMGKIIDTCFLLLVTTFIVLCIVYQ